MLPTSDIKKLFDFLDLASLCDPTIPVVPLLGMVGVTAERIDEFIDSMDDALGVDQEDGIVEDVGFQHPGFSRSLLLYRFRNPLLPEAILRRHPNPDALAVRVLNALSSSLRPGTRAVASLYMRLAERARIELEAGQYGKLLSYWSSLNETETLAQAVRLEVQRGDISPQLLWSIIENTQSSWPPARRLALSEAYGQQPDGVRLSKRFQYLLAKGQALYELARFHEAIQAGEDAISRQLEPSTREQIAAYSLLGMSEMRLIRFSEAASWLESAASSARANLPSDDLQLASSLHNLATLYIEWGRLEEAEPPCQQALAIQETVLGPDHLYVARTLTTLAVLYGGQKRYAEAESRCQRALAIQERVLSPDHPDVAVSLTSLARLYLNQGKYEEAEPLCQRARAIQEKVLGPDNADPITLDNLATLYAKQGKDAEALQLYRRIITDFLKTLHCFPPTPDDPDGSGPTLDRS